MVSQIEASLFPYQSFIAARKPPDQSFLLRPAVEFFTAGRLYWRFALPKGRAVTGTIGDRCMYTLQFDGLFKPAQGTNPAEQAGFMCYGWLIWKDARVIARGHGGVARGQAATSNTAEYIALIEGLDALRDMLTPQNTGDGVCEQPVMVVGDARSVIDQMQQASQILSADTRLLNERARRISVQFMQIRWAWMPREKNRAADALTRRAMRQIRQDEKNYQAAVEFIDRQGGSKRTLPLVDLRVYQPAA